MKWLRWHHGTVNDPKWRAVARKTGEPVASVVAVWAAVLENASQSPVRGELDGWDPEDVAAALDLSEESVDAIYEAMQGKVLDDEKLLAWDKRNPKREDDSAERVRRYRERKERKETDRNADVTHRNAPEGEGEVEEETSSPNGLGASSNAPSVKKRFPATPPKHGTEYAYPAEFEAAWDAYPKRDGGNPKMGAYKAWRARAVRGEPTDNLLAAAEHYATHCAVKEMEGTNFVQQTATFYGPSEPYREFVEGPGLNGHAPRAPPRPLTAEQRKQYSHLRSQLEAQGLGPERAAERAMEQVRGSQ